jgi:hypothetical protein
MGLMDKVKAQANVLAQKTQETAREGKARYDQAQANRVADTMMRNLGAVVFVEETGRAAADSADQKARLIASLSAHEAEHGIVLAPQQAPGWVPQQGGASQDPAGQDGTPEGGAPQGGPADGAPQGGPAADGAPQGGTPPGDPGDSDFPPSGTTFPESGGNTTFPPSGGEATFPEPGSSTVPDPGDGTSFPPETPPPAR